MPSARRPKASAILMYLLGSLAFIAFATITDKRVFTEPRQADGFFAQIEVARNFDPVRDRDIESWTFRLFHFFRYIAVYPLIYCDDNEFPAYCQAMFICMCILPIACANLPCIDSTRKTMVFILPCLVSYRATLICCSIAYMFLLLLSRNRSTPLLVASAVFANLSSGTMLSWLIITALCGGQHIRKQRLLLPVACVLVASMVAQGANKAAFFGSRNTVRVDAKVEIVEIAWNAILRSTIIVSIENQHYYRLAVYLLLAGGGGWVIGRLCS